MSTKRRDDAIVTLLLRLGLGFVFVYAAVASLRQPLVWEGYLPNFLTHLVSAAILIKVIAIYEFGLAVLLVIGKYIQYAALLSAVTLVGIVIANPSQFITTFRDVGLALMAVSLFFQTRRKDNGKA